MKSLRTSIVAHLVLVWVILGFDGVRSDDQPRLLCEPDDLQPPNRIDTTSRVAELRGLMEAENISAYIVLTNDDHQSEYTAEADKRRAFITGFTGSEGVAVITSKDQALWTDSRYHLQADEQIDCNWRLMRHGLSTVPTMEQWIIEQLTANQSISVDSRTIQQSKWVEWNTTFRAKGLVLKETTGNLVDTVWGAERPPYSSSPAVVHDEVRYAGRTWRQKAQDAAAAVRQEGGQALVVNALDEVAWLLNIRSDDVPNIPVVRAYVTLELKGDGTPTEQTPVIHLYIDPVKVTPELQTHLRVGENDGVVMRNYTDFWKGLEEMSSRIKSNYSVIVATEFSYNLGASHAIHSKFPDHLLNPKPPQIAILKDKKNPVEAEGMRNAHIRDAAALITFLAKLEVEVKAGVPWDEIKASEEVAKLRALQDLNKGPSFDSTSASGSHSAMPHYTPTPETNAPINTSSIYKLDSGGQYLDGTTDVTRTVHMGIPTPDQVNMYTSVLAGCIDINMVTFPLGTNVRQLELLSRRPLYEYGRDYGHGTTHGIGVYLGVHEEPGYYEAGEYGIRLENIVTIIKADFNKTTNDKTYLKFETVTMVPYERNLIDVAQLSPKQVAWVNAYHAKVRALVRPLLVQQGATQALAWLDDRTLVPLEPVCSAASHQEL